MPTTCPTLLSLALIPLAGPTAAQTPPPGDDATQPVWADHDSDGFVDVLATDAGGRLRLLCGDGLGGFDDRTVSSGLAPYADARLARWGDVDGDRRLDLVLVTRGGAALLLRQVERGSFVADADPVVAEGALDARWIDWDGDARPDLVLRTAAGDRFLHNAGEGRLEAVALTGGGSASGSAVSTVAAPPIAPDASPERPPASSAAGGGSNATRGGTPGAGTPIPPVPPTDPMVGCADTLVDQATGLCISASSAATLGMLYPLSNDLFVDDLTGFVGIGTIAPTAQLDVNGPAHVAGTITSSATGAPFSVSSTTLNPNLNADLLDGFDSAAFSMFGAQVDTGEIADFAVTNDKIALETISSARILNGTILDFDISLTAGIQGRKIDPNFGDQNIRTTGFISPDFGTTTSPAYRFGGFGEPTGFSSPSPNTISVITGGEERLRVIGSGNVGIGTDPVSLAQLTVASNNGLEAAILVPTISGPALQVEDALVGLLVEECDSGIMINQCGGNLFTGPNGDFVVDNDGEVVTPAITITGGADLVEGFDGEAAEPGSVMVIDAENPGDLRVAHAPYDTKVAGVVSGAGGVRAGLRLAQEGVLEGETLLAMAGRVYVKASAENGAIRPGDLLTTSATPGHAMRADEPERSFGAVIGKAMGSLDEGTGLVLVLVNLQ